MMKNIQMIITKKCLACLVTILVSATIITSIFLWRSKEQYYPDLWESVDNPISSFSSKTAIIQTVDEVCWLTGFDAYNFQSWAAGFSTTGQSDQNIKDNWTYRIIFTDASMADCSITNYAILIPHTAEMHYIYINCDQHIIQVDNVSYILKQEHVETLYSIVAKRCKYAKRDGNFIKQNIIIE